MSITITEFITRNGNFMQSGLDAAILAGLNRGMKRAMAFAVQDAMSRGASTSSAYGGRFYSLDRRQRNGLSTKRMWQTIKTIPAEKSGDTYTAGLQAGDSDVKYARIQELGGTTRPHVILPKYGKYLLFWGKAGWTFAKRVNHPGSKIPARPYLRPALTLATPLIREEVRQAVIAKYREMVFG